MEIDTEAREHGDGASPEEPSGFERALEGLRETGASVTIRELVGQLAKHGSEEGKILADYERVAATASDPAVRYLVDLIMDDERRHHRILVELATAMAWNTLGSERSPIPTLGWRPDEEVAAATRTLREYEEQDRHELQTLKRELRPFEETTLWALMVELMILDTEKHTAILKFLERYARGE